MNLPCEIVMDLVALYQDGLANPVTKKQCSGAFADLSRLSSVLQTISQIFSKTLRNGTDSSRKHSGTGVLPTGGKNAP